MQYFLTNGKRNSWLLQWHCFYFGSENWYPKSLWKNGKQLNVEKVLLVWNRNAELLRLVGATVDSKVVFVRRMRKNDLILLISLQKKSSQFFVLFVCRYWHSICQILVERVRKIAICSLNILMTMLYFSIL